MRVLVLFSVLSLAAGTASAQEGANCDAARRVVERYIALDLQGEGTHASTKMRALIDYRGRDTPGWDTLVLTGESRIERCKDAGNRVIVDIAHKVYGNVDTLTADSIKQAVAKPMTAELTQLRLNKTAQGWKIDSPTVYVPHVGVAAARRISKGAQP